jgi:predicted RNA-binding Zn ribbon-like protein
MQVMIFCERPGLICAGQRHPEFATYFAGRFTAAELRELIANRFLTVCIGQRLAADQVDEFLSKNNPAEEQGTSAEAAEGKAVSADAAFLNKVQGEMMETAAKLPLQTPAKRVPKARR